MVGRVVERRIEVKYEPLEHFRAIHEDKSRLILVYGGWRSGKTMFGAGDALRLCLDYPGIHGYICRQTYRELEDTTKKIFLSLLPEGFFRLRKNDNMVEFMNGSEVYFRSLDTASKVLGEVGFFVVDQAEEISQDMFFVLNSRLSQKGMPHRGILLCNPSLCTHWIYQYFIQQKRENCGVYQVSTYLNRANLPEGYIENLERNYPPEWVARYVRGEWGLIASGRRVYTEFRRDLHVRPLQYKIGHPIYRGWDFGFYHPACVWTQIDEDNRLLVLYSIMGENIALEKFIEKVIIESQRRFPMAGEYYDFCDPAGNIKSDKSQRTSIEIMIKAGLRPRFKYTIVQKGINVLMKKMCTLSSGMPELLVDPINQVLIEGFEGGYKYAGSSDDPEKDGYYEHLQDALRYVVNNMFVGLPTIRRTNPVVRFEEKRNLWTGY